MRALAMSLLLALLAGPALAQGPDGSLRLATGQTGQTYHRVYGVNLRRFLRQFKVRFVTTEGSIANLELLADGDADLAFAQADVYAAAVRRDPERFGSLKVLGRLADECVYIAHRKDGPVGSLADLKAPVGGRRAPRVAVGPEESGGSYTWTYLATLDPALEQPAVENMGGTFAMNKLIGGVIDAVIWVTDPNNMEHELLRVVKANGELALMNVNEPTLEYQIPDGPVIYQTKRVRTGGGWFLTNLFAPSITTLCTAALVIAREGTDPTAVEIVTNALSLNRDELIADR